MYSPFLDVKIFLDIYLFISVDIFVYILKSKKFTLLPISKYYEF